MADNQVFAEDGTLLGLAVPGEDGDTLLMAPDGRVVSGVNADLEPIDHAALYPEFVEQAEPDRMAALDARLDRLQELASRPRQVQQVAAQPSLDDLADDIGAQLDSVARIRGAPLTHPEVLTVLARVNEDVEAGRPPNVYGALERAQAEHGPALRDLDSDADRQAWMVDRLESQEAEEREADFGGPKPPRRESYDLDNDTARAEWMTDALEGRLGEDPTVHLQGGPDDADPV